MPKEHGGKVVCTTCTNHKSDSGFLQSWPEASKEKKQEWVQAGLVSSTKEGARPRKVLLEHCGHLK